MTRWKRSFAGIPAFLLSTYSSALLALPYTEGDDAGNTLATARAVPAGTDKITGNLSDLDTDIFALTYGTAVSFTAFNLTGANAFGTIRLLDSSGALIDSCVGTPAPGFPADVYCWISNRNTTNTILSASLAAGQYYLRFSDTSPNIPVGTYSLEFTATSPIPAPASLALLASGLVILGVARRRRKP